MKNSTANPVVGNEAYVDLFGVVEALWQRKVVMALSTFFVGIVTLTATFQLADSYRSEALLAPAEDVLSTASALSRQAGSLSGLAGFALPNAQGVEKQDLAIAILQSRSFLVDFIQRRNLAPLLIAAESWDRATGKVKFDASLYDVERSEWILDSNLRPSNEDLFEALRSRLSVEVRSRTGLIDFGVIHVSPRVAAQWSEWLIADLNREIRNRDIREAEESIAFLDREAAKTSVAVLQESLYELIKEQTKTMKLAQVRTEYAMRFVDLPSIPETPAQPMRLLLTLLVMLVWTLLCSGYLIIRYVLGISVSTQEGS